jgi:hypothetical protein
MAFSANGRTLTVDGLNLALRSNRYDMNAKLEGVEQLTGTLTKQQFPPDREERPEA